MLKINLKHDFSFDCMFSIPVELSQETSYDNCFFFINKSGIVDCDKVLKRVTHRLV